MNIAIIGTGYVGLVAGSCFAEMGNCVICMDIDAERISNLEKGIVPIFEPGLCEMVESNLKEKRLLFTSSYEVALAKSELCFIAVGTPAREDGSSDLSHVLSVAENIGKNLSQDQIIVNKSTVPAGTCDKIRRQVIQELQQRNLGEIVIQVADNPEFLKEGTAIEDFMHPDRIIIGADNLDVQRVLSDLYAPFVRNGHPIYFMDTKSAEITKYAANAMLANRISFMNEMAELCDKVGADIFMVKQGIGSDKRIGMAFLYAGLGYGGSCFPKDVKALIEMGIEYDLDMPLISSIEVTNTRQRKNFIDRVKAHFQENLLDKKIAVWGLAFKPMTDDMREAPSIEIIKGLCSMGARIVAYDPKAMKQALVYFAKECEEKSVVLTTDMYDVLERADALLVLTEWRQFRQADFSRLAEKMKHKVIFDGRNQYEHKVMQKYGFTYYCIGRNNYGE